MHYGKKDALLLIDPRPYQYALAKAKAEVFLAESSFQQQKKLVESLQHFIRE